MADNNKTANVKIIGTFDLQGDQARQTMLGLLNLQGDFTEALKRSTKQALLMSEELASPVNASNKKQFADGLNAALREMVGHLKQINTLDKTKAALISNKEAKDINDYAAKVNELARAQENFQKSKKIDQGNLGLDSTSTKDAIKSLNELKKARDALSAQVTKGGPNLQEYIQSQRVIDANTAALIKHIDVLRSATAMEKAHGEALAINARRDAGILKTREKLQQNQDFDERKKLQDFLAWREAAKQKAGEAELKVEERTNQLRRKLNEDQASFERRQEKARIDERAKMQADADLARNLAMKVAQEKADKLLNSGNANLKQNRINLDNSQIGRDAASTKFGLELQRTQREASPAYLQMMQEAQRRKDDEAALKSIYARANVTPEKQGFFNVAAQDVGNQARVDAAKTILALQKQLIALNQQSVTFDADSLRIRQQISAAIAAEIVARNKAGNIQAQQNQAERNLARIGGAGGASLLAVQASLMANYSILQGVTGSIKSAITGSIELEAAFRNVQAVTNTTKTEMGGLEQKIREVAAGTKFSSAEVAGAALTLGQAGMTAKEVGASIQPITMLAAAAGTSLSQAVDLVTSVVGVFDKKATNTAEIANKITAAANNSKVSVEKLALGFQYAGNTAAQMGISFEETTAAMAAMSNAGIKSGSTMGTGLRQFLVETQKPSEEFLKTMTRLGLSMNDLDFKSNGLVGVARKLREAGFIASDAIKSFDVRGAAAFNALIANPDELERQYRLLLNTQAGVEANAIQMDSLKSQSTRLTTSLVNLASVGFEPIAKVLAGLAGAFATLTQGASEFTVTTKILTSVIALGLTTAMGQYTLSLVSGALATRGFLGVSALLSVTIGGLTTALSTAWIAINRVLITGFLTAALNGSILSTALAVVTTGLRALGVALAGMSVLSGIGIALGVLGAAYYVLSGSTTKVKDEIDALRASVNESKGAYDEKAAVVKSLAEKIEELSYKQNANKISSEELKTVGMQLTTQFGAIGFSVDQTNNSYGNMIGKLKELKKQMTELSDEKLRIAAKENTALLTKQTNESNIELRNLNNNGTVSAIDKALKNAKLTKGETETLTAAKAAITSGKLENSSSIAGAQTIFDNLALDAGSKAGAVSKGRSGGFSSDATSANEFKAISKGMTDFLAMNTGRMQTVAAGGDLASKQEFRKDEDLYSKKIVVLDNPTKKMTLENVKEEFGGKAFDKFLKSTKPEADKLKEFDSFKDYAMSKAKDLKAVEQQLVTDLRDPEGKISKEVITSNLTSIRGKIEELKTDVTRGASATDSQAKYEYEDKMRLVNAKIAQPKKTADGKDGAKAALKEKRDLEFAYKSRGMTDEFQLKSLRKSLDESTDQRMTNIDNGGRKGGTKNVVARVTERVLKAEESQLIREADLLKQDATMAGDSEVAQAFLKKGVDKLKEASGKAVEIALTKQAAELKDIPAGELPRMQIVWKNEIEAIKGDFMARIGQFTDGFKGFGSAAAQKMKEMQDSIEKSKQRLTDLKLDNEDKRYEDSALLRELELERDIGKKVKGDKNFTSSTKYNYSYGESTSLKDTGLATENGVKVSNTIGANGVTNSTSAYSTENNGNQNRGGDGKSIAFANSTPLSGSLKLRIANEKIKVADRDLIRNQQELDLLGDEFSGLIGDETSKLKVVNEALVAVREKIKEFQGLMNTPGFTQEIREELSRLKAELPKLEESFNKSKSDLNSTRKTKNSTLEARKGIYTERAQYTKELPQEVNLENIDKSIDKVMEHWREAVQEMDTMKVLEDGMAGIFGGLTGQLGNTFAAMATGTKSVKDGFRDMAISVIKSMVDILAQAMAMQAVKGILSMFGGESAAAAGGGSPLFAAGSVATGLATGGFITPSGQIERVRKFAIGGTVNGGVQGRDSVPAMLMPGEFVMRKKAVESVGTDYLHSLNTAGNNVVSSGSPKAASSDSKSEGSVVNVWVVTPDQKPGSMGPKDIIAVVSDDIARGGSVKKLIKQVQTNQI